MIRGWGLTYLPRSGETVGGQKVRDLIFRKRKDNLESQWSAFTADDLEAEVSGFIPAGVGFFRFFIKEVFLEKAADGKFVEGRGRQARYLLYTRKVLSHQNHRRFRRLSYLYRKHKNRRLN